MQYGVTLIAVLHRDTHVALIAILHRDSELLLCTVKSVNHLYLLTKLNSLFKGHTCHMFSNVAKLDSHGHDHGLLYTGCEQNKENFAILVKC